MKKSNAGRPKTEKKSKQFNISFDLHKIERINNAGRIQYMSMSQYVNSLVDNDLRSVNLAEPLK